MRSDGGCCGCDGLSFGSENVVDGKTEILEITDNKMITENPEHIETNMRKQEGLFFSETYGRISRVSS